MLDALDDEDRVKLARKLSVHVEVCLRGRERGTGGKQATNPEQRSHEGEQGAVEDFEGARSERHTQPLLDAGQVLRPEVLAGQEDQGDAEADEETPLENRINRIEHSFGAQETPHKRTGIERIPVVGAREAGRLVGGAESGDLV